MSINNRVAIITGAARGIGNAIARGFAHNGMHVVINYIEHEQEVIKTVHDIEAHGGQAMAYRADVTSEAEIRDMVEATAERFGSVDILVNNAGIYPRTAWYEITEQEWDRVVGVNLKGCFLCSKAVYPYMKQNHWGRIINVSSVTVWSGQENLAHYVASKAGIIGLTRTVAREAGRDGITVNAVTPGAIQTETELEMFADQQEAFEEHFATVQSIPRRIVSEDLVSTFVYLASDQSGAITGQTINVDGGWMMH